MERLQAAIEKARAERTKAQSGVAPAQRPGKSQPMVSKGTPDQTDGTAWDALDEFKVDQKRLRRNRVQTFDGNSDSAPFDLLRTRMLQQAREHGWHRIGIVSPHHNVGKSTVALNLAFSLSRQREIHSIVLDLDLRRRGMTHILGATHGVGIADALQREADFADIAQRFGPNVAFGLNSDHRIPNPSEILQSNRTTEVLNEIEARYEPDIVLVDLPPIMESDDNFGFLKNVDCALIIAAADKTPMSQIDVAERHVSDLTNVMGIVLNKCRYQSATYGHAYDDY